MRYFKQKALLATALTVASVSSFAQSVDTTVVEAELGQLPALMGTVGGLLIAGAAAAIGYKWIKGAIFS